MSHDQVCMSHDIRILDIRMAEQLVGPGELKIVCEGKYIALGRTECRVLIKRVEV